MACFLLKPQRLLDILYLSMLRSLLMFHQDHSLTGIARQVMISAFFLDKMLNRVLKTEVDLSAAQFRMLAGLYFHGKTPQSQLAKMWDIAESSAKRQIDLLHTREFIRFDTSTPGRSVPIELTDAGIGVVRQSLEHISQVLDEKCRSLSEEDRKSLGLLLHKFTAGLKDEFTDACKTK